MAGGNGDDDARLADREVAGPMQERDLAAAASRRSSSPAISRSRSAASSSHAS